MSSRRHWQKELEKSFIELVSELMQLEHLARIDHFVNKSIHQLIFAHMLLLLLRGLMSALMYIDVY